MPKVVIQVRTRDNLLNILADGNSPAWRVGVETEKKLTHVQVVNFEGTQMIEGVYDRAASYRRDDGDVVLHFIDGCITNCKIEFEGQNPVRIIPSAIT